jgi:hypothetical protein
MKFQAVVMGAGCFVGLWVAMAVAESELGAALPVRELSAAELIDDLADDRFKVREAASRELWKLGDEVLPALQAAAASKEPEQAYRARELIRKIELYITPDTDPSVVALVEQYSKSSINERRSLYQKLLRKKAWRQILKLYASETNADLQTDFQSMADGVAVAAARDCLMRDNPKGAREFLEMAPASASGLLALADFHRSQGALEGELKRALSLDGPKSAAWQLALHRASGNLEAAQAAAEAAGETKISAAMKVLLGDPLPWMRATLSEVEGDEVYEPYVELAIKRWNGQPLRATDLEVLERATQSRDSSERGRGISALFLLGEATRAQAALTKSSAQDAFVYFDSLEMIPEALAALGLGGDTPDYAAWVDERVRRLSKEEDELEEGRVDVAELLLLANFLERRGLQAQAEDAFLKPLAALAESDEKRFTETLGMLFADQKSMGGAPGLAWKIAVDWAGDADERWDEILGMVFGQEISPFWEWLKELDPAASRGERLAGLLALTGKIYDPNHLRERWLNLGWTQLEQIPEEKRQPTFDKLRLLTLMKPDVASVRKLWDLASPPAKSGTGSRFMDVELSAAGMWDEAANLLGVAFELEAKHGREPNLELRARAAGYLRRAGRLAEADAMDERIDKLALGRNATEIATGYLCSGDTARAKEWYARACRQADPENEGFHESLDKAAPYLLEAGEWRSAASYLEVLTMIWADENNGSNPSSGTHSYRLEADLARALARLGTDRAGSLALLERCHRMCITSGSLADHFFPALRKAGLIEQHDAWFKISWDALAAILKTYPDSDNTCNTLAWLGSRAVRNLDQADELVTRAMQLNPAEPNYIDTMAEIQFARGNREKALEWSVRALNFSPNNQTMRRQYAHFFSDPLPE